MIKTKQPVQPSSHAHATGVVYLIYFATAILGLFLSSRKLPVGAMMAWPSDVLYATLTILLYRLFRPEQPVLSLVATLFSLAGCVTDGLHQLRVAGISEQSPLLFFGPFCMLLGLLILRSRFLPHWLGWPLILAGLGWIVYLIPGVALHAKIVIFPVGFVAEFELMLWLLLRGVNETRWMEQGHRA